MNKIYGKIINCKKTFFGSISFTNKITKINSETENNEDLIIPGFIDPHCHGAIGADTMQGYEAINKMSLFHLEHGTTSILPSTWTSTISHTKNALKNIKSNNRAGNIFGIHLEGPFINPKKLGAQPALSIEPSIEFLDEILDIADVRTITIAPELNGMESFIKYLDSKKIGIQFGHSLASSECCTKYMDKYNISFTHLYNAMSGNDHRNPGVLSAALAYGTYAEIICDKLHVSSEAIKIAKKSINKLYAVTDSVSVNGLQDGEYKLFNNDIVKKGNTIKLKNNNTLAGSVVTMYDIFINLIELGYDLNEAVEMTSSNAAEFLNLDNVGHIKENYLSNFIVLDKKYKIKDIYLKGEKVEKKLISS